jgi:hypothetical protein
MGIRRGDPKLVLGPLVSQSDELYATVGIEVDQVASDGLDETLANTPIPRSSSLPARYIFCSNTE